MFLAPGGLPLFLGPSGPPVSPAISLRFGSGAGLSGTALAFGGLADLLLVPNCDGCACFGGLADLLLVPGIGGDAIGTLICADLLLVPGIAGGAGTLICADGSLETRGGSLDASSLPDGLGQLPSRSLIVLSFLRLHQLAFALGGLQYQQQHY